MSRKFVVLIEVLILVFVLFGMGCARLHIQREYDAEGLVREEILADGFFVKRANQLNIDRSSSALEGEKDLLRSMIDEDPSPGNEAMSNFIEIFKLGMTAAAK